MQALLYQSLLKFQRAQLLTNQDQLLSQVKFSDNIRRKRALIYCLKIASASEQIFLNSCLREPKSICIAQREKKATSSLPAFQKPKLGVVRSILTKIKLLPLKTKYQVSRRQRILIVLRSISLKLKLANEKRLRRDF
jgi:hypothetical protein